MDSQDKQRLDALHQKLLDAQARQSEGEKRPAKGSHVSHMGIAYRMVIEMAAGIAIGFGMGYGLDYLFGTQPIFLVVGCLFGFAAGIKVMMESAREYEAKRKLEEENGE